MTQLLFLLLSVFLGALCGCVIWIFFKLMDIGIIIFWEALPSALNFSWYPIAACALGGIIIGLYHKKFGDYPETLEEVMTVVKEKHRYEYKNAPVIALGALLPLIFGGSVGPEAGLSGVIAGLCTWVGDRFKYVAKGIDEMAQIGISASLAVIFSMPLFGFIAPIESDDDSVAIPQKAKVFIYFAAIFGGLGAYTLLTSLLGGSMHLGRFDAVEVSLKELLFFIPLSLTGIVAGYFYLFSGKLTEHILKPFKRFPVLRGLLGGVSLGVCGMLLPFTMFSGESQMTDVMTDWTSMTAAVLLATGFFKIILTNICIRTGWTGGNIFPLIFSGICIGYGLAHLAGIDGVFAVAAVTAALCGMVMRKPISVVLVLLLCFPLKGVISMSLAAFIGAYAPLPSAFKQGHQTGE